MLRLFRQIFRVETDRGSHRLSVGSVEGPNEDGKKLSANIIIHRTGQLGDTIVSLPAMRAIRAAYPNHNLVLLADRQRDNGLVSGWDVLSATGLFSDVLFYAPPSGKSKMVQWFGLLKLVFAIRRLKPGALFYLRDFPGNRLGRDAFFFRVLCGISGCCGFEPTNHLFGRRDSRGHLIRFPSEVIRLLELVAKAGVPLPKPDEIDFSLPISGKDRSRVDTLWQEAGIPARALLIGLGPGSKMAAKQWPLHRFIEVGRDLLVNLPSCWLIIFGGPGDQELGNKIRAVLGDRVINAAGRLSVLESAEALRRCSVYVGNDTGVMHLAAAAGTPCVGIFSARDHPGRWEPYGPQHIVLRKEPPCAGCLLEVCIKHDMICLKEIHISEVMDAIRYILKAQTKWETKSSQMSDMAVD